MGLNVSLPSCGGTPKITVNVNHGNDLNNLPYADSDADAKGKGVAIKGFYLASDTNIIGAKYGTLVRREY